MSDKEKIDISVRYQSKKNKYDHEKLTRYFDFDLFPTVLNTKNYLSLSTCSNKWQLSVTGESMCTKYWLTA